MRPDFRGFFYCRKYLGFRYLDVVIRERAELALWFIRWRSPYNGGVIRQRADNPDKCGFCKVKVAAYRISHETESFKKAPLSGCKTTT